MDLDAPSPAKRPASSDSDDSAALPASKKPRVQSHDASAAREPDQVELAADSEDATPAIESFSLTQHHQTRCAVQRSIALVLRRDGFASASPAALESFTELVETCVCNFPLPQCIQFPLTLVSKISSPS